MQSELVRKSDGKTITAMIVDETGSIILLDEGYAEYQFDKSTGILNEILGDDSLKRVAGTFKLHD